MDVLGLLRSKNRCLQKFLQASRAFLESAETSGELPDVPPFEAEREAILKAIDLYDRKIGEAVALLDQGTRQAPPQEWIDEIRANLDEKTRIVHEIVSLDDQILALITAEKNNILKKLSSAQKQAEIARKFKSTWIGGSGEGIDEKL